MSDSVRPHRWQPTMLPRPWGSPGKSTGVGCHFLLQCMKGKRESEVAQLCPTLCDPMDCSPPGSSIHGIFQARVLEWVAISFSRGSSQPRGPALQGDALPSGPPGQTHRKEPGPTCSYRVRVSLYGVPEAGSSCELVQCACQHRGHTCQSLREGQRG